MSEAASAKPGMSSGRAAVIAAGLVFFDSLLGQLATFPNLKPWYESLNKPELNPPNWIFGPVWTLLYAMMALAFWRVLILPARRARRLAILAFLAQLLLNVLWSFGFFAAHSPLLGLVDILPQEILVMFTLWLFWRLDRLAGLCLVPLALWVAFAAVLNIEIWRLNG